MGEHLVRFTEPVVKKTMHQYSIKADILIKNGRIVDGTGNPNYVADLAIKDGIIQYIGNNPNIEADLTINASGKLVTPGFIDSHSHSDATIWANPECQSTVRQGVTTEIVGQCGMVGPLFAKHSIESKPGQPLTIYEALPPEGSFKTVFPRIEDMGVSENLMFMCGHNKLREIAGIATSEYTEEQFSIMERHLREALESGYAGFSSGLEFLPGLLATSEEISRLVGIVKEYDGIYTSHIRNRDSDVIAALEEFIDVIQTHRIRGIVSHLSIRENTGAPDNALRDCISRLHEIRDSEGLNILTDMIPSLYAMGPMVTLLPAWVTAGGWENARKILADPQQRRILRTDCDRYWRFIHRGEWDRVRVQFAPAFPEIAGLSFPEVAKKWQKDEWDCLFDILMSARHLTEVRHTTMTSRAFSEEDVVESITDPLFMWAVDGYTSVVDGPLAAETSNPKHYKDMMYFLTHHIRDNKVISLEKGISKLTSLPASFYKLRKRGQILEGFIADINVFDLDALKVSATFENPYVYSTGMDYVLVNGVPVIAAGDHTHARPGMVLRGN